MPSEHTPETQEDVNASLRQLGRWLWSALDEVRSRDARWLGPELRRLHTELGDLLRKSEETTP